MPDSTSRRLRIHARPTRRRRGHHDRSRLAPAFAAAVVVAAIVGAYWLGGRTTTAPVTPAAPTHFVISAPPGTQIVSGHREVAISTDGQQIAFIARGAKDQHIYVRRLDELTPHQVAGTEGARDLTFSPDGRWLAFHAGSKIRKVSLAGGAPANLADSAARPRAGVACRRRRDLLRPAPGERHLEGSGERRFRGGGGDDARHDAQRALARVADPHGRRAHVDFHRELERRTVGRTNRGVRDAGDRRRARRCVRAGPRFR